MHTASKESKAVRCAYCPKEMLTESALVMHMKSHVFKNRMFVCLYCSEGFQHATEINAHVVVHMENGAYNCRKCHKVRLY